MHDQADYLRRLVRQDGAPKAARAPGAPHLIAVLGGKGGVGATTLALNVAVALAQLGQRLVLVDADLEGANISSLCQVPEGDSLLDVLRGRCSLHEVLRPGPAGLQVLPGRWAPGELTDCPPEAQERLLQQLRGLGRHVETVILDVGSGLSPRVRRFVEAVETVLLITTPDPISVMDTYAAIKLLLMPDRQQWVGAAVNCVQQAHEAEETQQRLALCCRRFLGRRLQAAGQVPFDPQVPLAARTRVPLFLSHPQAPAAVGCQHLAAALAAARWQKEANVPGPTTQVSESASTLV